MNRCIRSYQPGDFPAVVDLVQASITTLAANVKSFLDGADAIVCEDGGVIKGLAAATQPSGDHGRQAVRFRLCTHPRYRHQGIGSALWQAIAGSLNRPGVELVTTSYRCDRDDARRFFTDMRRTNDIKPNVIFGPESFGDEKLRQEMLANRDNLYVFLVDGEMIGLAELESGRDANAVDRIAVKPAYRGRGYGSAITQFCINRVREWGVHRVYISVVDTNTVARRLYDSLGCTLEQSVEQARLRLPGSERDS